MLFLPFDFGILTNRSKGWWCILKFCFEIVFWSFELLMEEILGLKQVRQDLKETYYSDLPASLFKSDAHINICDKFLTNGKSSFGIPGFGTVCSFLSLFAEK